MERKYTVGAEVLALGKVVDKMNKHRVSNTITLGPFCLIHLCYSTSDKPWGMLDASYMTKILLRENIWTVGS